VDVHDIGAPLTSPFPQALWRWDGFVRGPHGIHETQIGLRKGPQLSADPEDDPTAERKFYIEAAPNQFIEQARKPGGVQQVLRYARFPVTRFHMDGHPGSSVRRTTAKDFSQIL
jgi:hypothetical protein